MNSLLLSIYSEHVVSEYCASNLCFAEVYKAKDEYVKDRMRSCAVHLMIITIPIVWARGPVGPAFRSDCISGLRDQSIKLN